MGIQAVWDVALPGQRRPSPCRRGPSALVLLDGGSDQFLGTRLSDPDFGSGFQASLPRGLKLYVDPRIS